MLHVPELRLTCSPPEDHGEVAVPLQVHSGANIHLQPMEDPTPEQVDAKRRQTQ